MRLQKIISFGFKYLDLPARDPGVVVVDVRSMFRNPHRDKALRDRTGMDPAVQAVIRLTPNFQALYAHVKQRIVAPGVEVAYIGCIGGRHRSVYLAERLGQELGVAVEHRDLTRT